MNPVTKKNFKYLFLFLPSGIVALNYVKIKKNVT